MQKRKKSGNQVFCEVLNERNIRQKGLAKPGKTEDKIFNTQRNKILLLCELFVF